MFKQGNQFPPDSIRSCIMTIDELFDLLDLDKDGELSRSELHRAAKQLGWHWREAPTLAVLDLFTTSEPISKNTFIACMEQIAKDPLGPYGTVLLNSPHFSSAPTAKADLVSHGEREEVHNAAKKQHRGTTDDGIDDEVITLLEQTAGTGAARDYERLLKTLERAHVSVDDTALLLIDPQRSFTRGVWMQSMGSRAEVEVKPIALAFNKCARFLENNYRRVEAMFSRCPFPPDSYHWDDELAGIVESTQLYFVKPGNSILFPPTNGFREWIAACIENGKRALVMGGCTLNSCVRVSSIETQHHFESQRLQVVVDLSLSGARASNFLTSSLYGGLSAVESAVREMLSEGVRVVRCVEWK